jgi:hypothetical protein
MNDIAVVVLPAPFGPAIINICFVMRSISGKLSVPQVKYAKLHSLPKTTLSFNINMPEKQKFVKKGSSSPAIPREAFSL